MSNDEQYGHQLGLRLRREVAEVHAAADLVPRLRRRRTRRTWAIRAAIAGPVAVLAAATVVVATAGAGAPAVGHQPTAGSSATTRVQVVDVAYVQAQTVKALSDAAHYVIYAKSVWSHGHYDTWFDKAAQRYRNDIYDPTYPSFPPNKDGSIHVPALGEVTLGPVHLTQSHQVSGPWGNQYMLTVDYDQRTWSTSYDTGPRPPSVMPDPTDPDSIRKAIHDGTLQLVGEETVDNIDTLHLRLYGPHRSYRIDLWVDAKTYLPVKDIAAKSGGSGPQEFPAEYAETTTYTWLPRTAENLAYLVLTPPPGFRHVR